MNNSNNNKHKLKFPLNKTGVAQQQFWVDEIKGFSGNLPQSVLLEDIDKSFFEMVRDDLAPIVDYLQPDKSIVKRRIPTIPMTLQAWSDYSKTWELKINNVEMTFPFILVIRQPELEHGTSHNGYYNIPGRRNWTWMKVPNVENGRDVIDLYKIPQPTAVDISYDVKLFCTRMDEVNAMNESIFKNYNSLQKYINVKGHPMPSLNEGVTDESEMDIEDKKMLINSFGIKVQGYILDSNDFELVRQIDRTTTTIGLTKPKNIRKNK